MPPTHTLQSEKEKDDKKLEDIENNDVVKDSLESSTFFPAFGEVINFKSYNALVYLQVPLCIGLPCYSFADANQTIRIRFRRVLMHDFVRAISQMMIND